jgi:hypothetical protein
LKRGKPEGLETAKTLTEIQKVLNDLMDTSAANSMNGTHLLKNSA